MKSDRCSLSALLENFNSQPKESSLKLAITGNAIAMRGRAASRGSTVEPDESARVTWTLDAKRPGDASLKVTANTNGQSDIVEKQLLVHPDGIPIIEAKGGVVSGEESRAGVTLNVPEERRVSETTLTVRLTGDLGGTAAEAVPFLYESSYAGTGQTLEQFLPACGLQKVLEARGADIQSAEETSTQRPPSGLLGVIEETGEKSNPVFDADRVADAAKRGISNLAEMQLDDGGWGWFFGWGAVSNPFDTATVVHGLNRAKALGFEVDTDRIERGIEWLGRYEEEQIKQIRNYGVHAPPSAVEAGRRQRRRICLLYFGRTEETKSGYDRVPPA